MSQTHIVFMSELPFVSVEFPMTLCAGDIYCGVLGSVEEAKRRCCADTECQGLAMAIPGSDKAPGYGCMKANTDCGITVRQDFDGYNKTRQGAQPSPGLNISFSFGDVGFSLDTLVRVRDLFAQKDLGVFQGDYHALVPSHGVHMIKLTYEPKYKVAL